VIDIGAGEAVTVGALSGTGTLRKTGGGTLAVAGFDDFAGPLQWSEGTVEVQARVLPEPFPLPGGMVSHLDASAASSVLCESDGTSVTNLLDASGGPRSARPPIGYPRPQRVAGALNGRLVNGAIQGMDGGYQIMSLLTADSATASAFAADRFAGADAARMARTGGQRLGEVLVFNRVLSDSERRDVEAYLVRKWFGRLPQGYAGAGVEVAKVEFGGGELRAQDSEATVTIRSLLGTEDVIMRLLQNPPDAAPNGLCPGGFAGFFSGAAGPARDKRRRQGHI
jgi:hypothetical protein